MFKNSQKNRAFSLIEASIVLVVIGIFIAAIAATDALITKSRLRAAVNLSTNSPVRTIKENVLWLETSLEGSLSDVEESDGVPVTSWADQNSSSPSKSSVVAVGSGPTYANTINRVHAIKFSGSDNNYLKVVDASFLNNTDYTIMVLEKRQSATAGNFLSTTTSGDALDNKLSLGYASDTTINHSHGSTNYTSPAKVSSYDNSTDKARLFTFVHSATEGKKTYINGILASQDSSNTASLSGVTTLAIGKGYTGEIGEIAIFTKALKTEEMQAVSDYNAKKWTRPVPSAPVSCAGGTVTDDGCEMSCATSDFAGVSSPSTISDGQTVDATCGRSGFNGEVTSLTCSRGVISGTACQCNSGYGLVGTACVLQCSVNIVGSSNTTPVSLGAGSVTCDQANYDGSFSFTCSGSAITGTCDCAVGRSGSGCSSCDTANNYQMISGSCQKGCAIEEGSGVSATGVLPGTSTLACESEGYSGNLSYSCPTGGGAINITSHCTIAPCTGGTIDTTSVPGSTIHIFTSSGTLSCPGVRNAKVLVVAGGGGGSGGAAGAGGSGGGGGGVIYNSSFRIASSPITVTVGAGGDGSPSTGGSYPNADGSSGENSIFSSLIAVGGGGGGPRTDSTTPAPSGGSGGGGGVSGTPIAGGSGVAGQGYAGGSNYPGGPNYGGGGGGGAGGVGENGSGSKGGDGGIGRDVSITGSAVKYAGGGGSSNYQGGANGVGGAGGGGSAGSVGTDGLGGGGGGATSEGSNGFKGGKGIVIVRY